MNYCCSICVVFVFVVERETERPLSRPGTAKGACPHACLDTGIRANGRRASTCVVFIYQMKKVKWAMCDVALFSVGCLVGVGACSRTPSVSAATGMGRPPVSASQQLVVGEGVRVYFYPFARTAAHPELFSLVCFVLVCLTGTSCRLRRAR